MAVDDKVRADFALLGAKVAANRASEDEELLRIWDIHEQAWRTFLAMATQWRVASLSTMDSARLMRLGLDYAALPVVMKLCGICKGHKRVFAQIRVLEGAALDAFGEGTA